MAAEEDHAEIADQSGAEVGAVKYAAAQDLNQRPNGGKSTLRVGDVNTVQVSTRSTSKYSIFL